VTKGWLSGLVVVADRGGQGEDALQGDRRSAVSSKSALTVYAAQLSSLVDLSAGQAGATVPVVQG
jgi:hypothetical protein